MSIVNPIEHPEYEMFILPCRLEQWQFEFKITIIKNFGYTIVGMISDIDKDKNIIIVRHQDNESENTSHN